ncbi:hypothetical protein GCM10026982_16600 [Nocardiopsis aegyptia]
MSARVNQTAAPTAANTLMRVIPARVTCRRSNIRAVDRATVPLTMGALSKFY